MSLANDNITTLDEYVVIPINIEGVKAVIKAWFVDVEVYDFASWNGLGRPYYPSLLGHRGDRRS